MARTYKMRRFKNGANSRGEDFMNYSLTLPTPLADRLIDTFGTYDLEFEIALTEDGILYRPVETEVSVPEELPFQRAKRTASQTAATNGGADEDAPKPRGRKPKAQVEAPVAAPKPRGRKPKTQAEAPAPKAKPVAPKPAAKAPAKPAAPKGRAKPAAPAAKAKPTAPRAPRPRAKVPAAA